MNNNNIIDEFNLPQHPVYGQLSENWHCSKWMAQLADTFFNPPLYNASQTLYSYISISISHTWTWTLLKMDIGLVFCLCSHKQTPHELKKLTCGNELGDKYSHPQKVSDLILVQ